MDLEQRLRESLVAPDPGGEFTDAVMARAGQRRARRRRTLESAGWSRRRNRIIVIGIVAAIGVAAAMLGLRLSGARQQPLAVATSAPAALPAAPAVHAAADPVVIPAVQVPRPRKAPEKIAEIAAPPAPAPAAEENSVRYTVVATLRQQATDPEARAAVEKFYGLLLDELRKVPGITLRVSDPANPVPPGEGEYGLMIASLVTTTTATGFTSFRTSSGQGGFNAAMNGNPWPLELRVDRGEKAASRLLMGTSLLLASEGAPRPARCAQGIVVEHDVGVCGSVAQLAAGQAERLRTTVFPLDSAMRQQLVARVSESSVVAQQRSDALSRLLLATGHEAAAAGMDSGTAAAAVALATDLPSSRAGVWRMVRGHPNAAVVTPLLESLDRSIDEATRREALTTLVADYAGDPRVRAGLQVVVSDDPSEFLRALAGYAVSGVDAWRSYARATLKKEGLPPEEKVRPLVYTSDEASGAFQQAALEALANDPEIVDAVLAIARENRNETSVQRKGPIRRALFALQRPEGGPVLPGSRRQEAQQLYTEFSSHLQPMVDELRRSLGEPVGTTPAQ